MPTKGPEDVNEVLDVLKHHHRRDILLYFERRESSEARLSELVTHLDQEHPTVDRDTIEVALIHNHLPKLDTQGWISYDSETKRVFYSGHDQAESVLTALSEILEE